MKWSQVWFLSCPLWSICYWCSPDKPIPALIFAGGSLLAAIFMMAEIEGKIK